MTKLNERYPFKAQCKDGEITLHLMTAEHRNAMREFAHALPEHDLLFLRRKITEDKVLDAWIKSVETGDIVSLVAIRDGKILGCNTLIIDNHTWSSHVGEVRVLVSLEMREQGLGRILIQECFISGLFLGLEKLIAHMTADQDTAMTVFEEMGFVTEGLLKDHVKDGSGESHDLIVMGQDVERFHARMEMYGMDEAF